MNANEVIDSYVADVARKLSRKQRNDVAFELRALLNEELAAKAESEGRAADEAMALALVREFGRPDEVADRYRPQSFTIIAPADSRAFIQLALGGVGLQWLLSLPAVFAPGKHDAYAGEWLARLGQWWVTWGLGAFWWPGFLVSIAIIAGYSRHQWPAMNGPWKPSATDRDTVNRPLMALAMIAAVLGAAMMIFLPVILAQTISGHTGRVIGDVLAYDEGFVRSRGPWMILLWMAQIVLFGVVIAEGRWRQFTRRLEIALAAVMCVALVWFINAGPIWRAEATDKTAKGIIALIVVFILIDIGMKLRREFMRLRPPHLTAV